jgi:hypothetical protein
MNHHYSYSKLLPSTKWQHDMSIFTSSWLVPLLVWLTVMGTALAIAGFLLGEE